MRPKYSPSPGPSSVDEKNETGRTRKLYQSPQVLELRTYFGILIDLSMNLLVKCFEMSKGLERQGSKIL